MRVAGFTPRPVRRSVAGLARSHARLFGEASVLVRRKRTASAGRGATAGRDGPMGDWVMAGEKIGDNFACLLGSWNNVVVDFACAIGFRRSVAAA